MSNENFLNLLKEDALMNLVCSLGKREKEGYLII